MDKKITKEIPVSDEYQRESATEFSQRIAQELSALDGKKGHLMYLKNEIEIKLLKCENDRWLTVRDPSARRHK